MSRALHRGYAVPVPASEHQAMKWTENWLVLIPGSDLWA